VRGSLLRIFGTSGKDTVERLRERLGRFRDLVQKNDRVLALMAEAGEMLGGEYLFDQTFLQNLAEELRKTVLGVVQDLGTVTGDRYPDLLRSVEDIDGAVRAAMELRSPLPNAPSVLTMETVGMEHADSVGEKMARLGEVRNRLGLPVPDGFVVSTRACWDYLEKLGVTEAVRALDTTREGAPEVPLQDTGDLRRRILGGVLPSDLARSIRKAVSRMVEMDENVRFAVRSSATGEDGDLVAAGQYATLLGVAPDDVCKAYKEVVASLFTPGALAYQSGRGIPPGQGMMAVGFLKRTRKRYFLPSLQQKNMAPD